MHHLFISTIGAFSLAFSVLAHPGHNIDEEIAERAEYLLTTTIPRDLSHCTAKLKARGIDQVNIKRRAAIAKAARKKRGIATNTPYLKVRDIGKVLATNHTSPVRYSPATDETILFSGNSSCILTPEVTLGPYYVNGEYIREDVRETQAGIELILDTQVIDIATCEPVINTMVEIWHCNSTGVYSGIVKNSNGIGTAAPENINATFLRGLVATDSDGVAQFTTTFPGHYIGRTPHIHVTTHFNGSTNSNGTYSGGYVSHVGQVFFDQDLIYKVEATPVYSANTQALLLNVNDGIMSQEAAVGDPVVEYSLLGKSVEDGIFAWIAFGIDLTSHQTLTGAVTLTEGGGVANPGGGGGGGGPPPCPSGTVCTRPPPPGAPTSTVAAN